MVPKLNDLPTNLCCNSENCLPTNKWSIWICLSALTKVLLLVQVLEHFCITEAVDL